MKSWVFPRPEKVLVWALVGMVILIGGCCSRGPIRPFRPWFPPCDPIHCGESCGAEGTWVWQPAGGSPGVSEADLACQGCFPPPPAPPRYYPGPLSWLFDRIVWPYYPGFAGCGQRYWSPWTADPPDCCDPCDHWGRWIGTQRGTGYSSMYPSVFPGSVSSEILPGTEPETGPTMVPSPGPRQPARPGCAECGPGYQAGCRRMPSPRPFSELPNLLGLPPTPPASQQQLVSAEQGVCPASYSNLAQRPRQPYRDPVPR
ncbi:MAG: hypothetical protein NZ602_16090 [Thermoguttaceae bacterium]|nr:hypothetical protein [Thermoguttaceae bacterium]MDW8038063.1 hypothetical protein [Thermoguttaceae bacterium]